MRYALIATIRSFLAVVFVAIAFNARPAIAQGTGSGSDPLNLTGSFAFPYARYYAPYALQAAAAYVSVQRFNETLVGESKQPPLNGSDVELALGVYPSDPANPDFVERARKYLRAWQYQFGSEGYLPCFEQDPDCQRMIAANPPGRAISAGPAFHVWARTQYPKRERASCSEVSIAFRGTDTLGDWVGNLFPVTSYVYDDHYSQLRRNIDAIVKKITKLDCYRRAGRPQIVSVGHSLGAGLAHFAALANNPNNPRIAKVFAFDPSPVTGASLIDKGTLSTNVQNLEIDRVYQTGEVLQYVRRGVEWVQRRTRRQPISCEPLVRDVAFAVLPGSNTVRLHGMTGLARELVTLSYYPTGEQNQYFVPPRAGCTELRYKAPKSDEDLLPAPDSGPEMVYSPAASGGALARANRDRAVHSFLRTESFESAALQPPEMDGSVVMLARTKTLKSTRAAGVHKVKRDAPYAPNTGSSPEIAYAPNQSGVAFAEANRDYAVNTFLRTESFESAALQPMEIDGSVVMLARMKALKSARAAGVHKVKRAAKRPVPAVRFGVNVTPLGG